MKVLLVNKFLFPKGGDAVCTLSTGELLSEKSHTVEYWGMAHPENPHYSFEGHFSPLIDFSRNYGIVEQLKISFNILYSFESKKRFERVVSLFKPDVVHLHNFAHQISPSILHVIKKHNLPAVMTLHDYKLVCPVYTMFSNGKPCHRCRNRKYYWCLIEKCTKNSYLKSLINTVEMVLHHRIMRIYNLVDIFISPSKFLVKTSLDMGFRRKIVHLPNFIDTGEYPHLPESSPRELGYFGRLSPEKGLFTLLKAKRDFSLPLKIVGDGPLRKDLEDFSRVNKIKNVSFLGYMSAARLKKEISDSLVVVVPSEWYENNPLTVIEAFAAGKAVIGARIGGIPELIKEGKTGLTFEPGNVQDLRKKIKYVLDHPDRFIEMGKNARRFAEENFTPVKYYTRLVNIYRQAMKIKASSGI